ncbi:amidohydrolase family protein, partial [Ursidibacter maritimus]|uniref:amidohydrolase family protein n=1 Tax=Ursidibacter maritimus TaxID=1331689 RepID=UPI0034DAD21D
MWQGLPEPERHRDARLYRADQVPRRRAGTRRRRQADRAAAGQAERHDPVLDPGRTNKLDRADQRNSTLHFYRDLNRLGMTSAVDAGGGGQAYPDDYGVTLELAKEGKLTVRTAYYLFAQKAGKELEDYE